MENMVFTFKVKFTNPAERYQRTERFVKSCDFYQEVNVLNKMLAKGEIESYTVSHDESRVDTRWDFYEDGLFGRRKRLEIPKGTGSKGLYIGA